VYSPCITIQERDTQHLLVGLGPPRVRTPTHYFQQKASLQSLVSITAGIRFFAECHVPSVFFRALSKEAFCRVLNKKHSVKKTLGKEAALPFHSAKQFFKAYFEALNEFKSKSFQLQSFITSQDL
jgi:hypothetical protein